MWNEEGVVVDPEYWWREAEDMWRDAGILARNGGSRKAVCNFCHGTIERALKAVLAQEGKLSDADKRHGLRSLARDAGVFDGLEPRLKDFVSAASGLHSMATYPEREIQDQIWHDGAYYSIILRNTKEVYELLLEKRFERGEDAEDGSR